MILGVSVCNFVLSGRVKSCFVVLIPQLATILLVENNHRLPSVQVWSTLNPIDHAMFSGRNTKTLLVTERVNIVQFLMNCSLPRPFWLPTFSKRVYRVNLTMYTTGTPVIVLILKNYRLELKQY